MPRMRETKFKVRGRGVFPYDMLRYDRCFPDSQIDAAKLDGDIGEGGRRIVTLVQRHDSPRPHVTPERWASYGWNVMNGSEETR